MKRSSKFITGALAAALTFGSLVATIGPKNWEYYRHGYHQHGWHHHHEHGSDDGAASSPEESRP